MKTLLINDAGLDELAPIYGERPVKHCGAKAQKLKLIDNPNDAELAIIAGARRCRPAAR